MTHADAYPLRFRPLIKQTIWGGSKLGTMLGKPIGGDGNDAESWEIVDHGNDQSVLESGPLAGKTLAELIADDPVWLLGSKHSQSKNQFPLLLKYLDCNRVLSVQVHPDDAYGATMPVPDLGKTEAWYVVDADPGAVIYAGLKAGVDRGQLAEAVRAGETERVLHSFAPDPGDCVFIPAGTVHALGAGLVIAEIQQSSDTTFRLFDWNRVGADGQPRPLHIEQSLDVTDYESGPVPARKSHKSQSGWQTLVQCDKFTLDALEAGSDSVGGDDHFHILTVPRGSATLQAGNDTIKLARGQSVLLPAAIETCRVTVESGATVLHAGPPSE
ncbi:type I phosphomannose isomerase catalytic subunit [Roseiconus lacunae]|uniref:type I phosphomannose isomerase catalytic subunit n=1 Tax=Roseiconus lacunae TaxID=2605694 RepID=UPI001E32014A|nr:type I phosphomannose isomerase catalytic subunit [Roseiconus lacunae]MCD0462982.1 class I mannose-6-phosphate isomerase [Roseiconus lacunae]WRQ49091.1 type I phosphomannose isomerase catalytic subunit [Stieleria sp. HD01]